MFIIVLNASNVESGGDNNSLIFNFPNSVILKDKYIAVSQIVMYYAWFNITSAYNNNTFSYTWTVAGITTTYSVVIPDGLYNIVDINAYLQWTMINNGTYLINSSGDNEYYAELTVNPNRYAIQINTFLVPTTLPTGWTTPTNWVGFPTTTQNPVITIPSTGFFYKIIGYTAGFTTNANVGNAYVPPTASSSNNYVAKDSLGTLSYLSNTNPDVQPNSSIYLAISNINNPYSQPSSIIYSITPNVAIGEQIIETPPNFMWNKMIDGTYNQIRVQLLGIDKQPIQMKDPNMTIMLTIRDKDENLVGINN
jgi:hypothetical protein